MSQALLNAIASYSNGGLHYSTIVRRIESDPTQLVQVLCEELEATPLEVSELVETGKVAAWDK